VRQTDIVIAGGGLAGSLAAAMLGRAGINAILVDPNPVYPPDFRCEKLDRVQLETLQKTGFIEAVLRASTPDRDCWVARQGRRIDTLHGVTQRGILYDTLVNTIRSEIPGNTTIIQGKVADISTSPDRQTVKLSTGEEIDARLVVVATGLNIGTKHKLGITREVISAAHSISIGFDMKPAGRAAFPFSSLTYFSEKPADRMAYFTAFPIGSKTRVNLFAYRDMNDPWLKEFRDAPQDKLFAMWPALGRMIGDFTVPSFVRIRPVDLYVCHGHRQSGLVMVGDAFATSCPAAGTGARKVLVDVERLCNVHIPRWLATRGMGEAKIATFYDDPVKRECDAVSLRKAFSLRSCSIDPAPYWAAMRWGKFILRSGKGLVRRMMSASAGAPREDSVEEAPSWVRHPVRKLRASRAVIFESRIGLSGRD
jgi:2-polyprenyl-6-methoxyphenol hydroxylase-like FAD-dependent oxidoreductase